ncbi:hypothetical protein ACLKA6_001192 [Drosophila palustris]
MSRQRPKRGFRPSDGESSPAPWLLRLILGLGCSVSGRAHPPVVLVCRCVCVCVYVYRHNTWNRSCVREDCRDESCDRTDVFPLDSLSQRPLQTNPYYRKDNTKVLRPQEFVPGPGSPQGH